MIDVQVERLYGLTYQVIVDGRVYDTFRLRFGPRLTWSQLRDIAHGYREGLGT